MRQAASLLITLTLLVAACAGTEAREEIHVAAAASLTDPFTELASIYEARHPDSDIVLNLASSTQLREQILEGSLADVFASADPAIMEELTAAGAVTGASRFLATTGLAIVVPQGNPAGVSGLESLSDPTLLVGLCSEGVPCGDLARQALDLAGVSALVDTNEPNARSLRTKVELGELDVAILYASDLASSAELEGIPMPGVSVVARYPIAVLADGRNPAGAQRFVDFVLSDEGQAILGKYGFSQP